MGGEEAAGEWLVRSQLTSSSAEGRDCLLCYANGFYYAAGLRSERGVRLPASPRLSPPSSSRQRPTSLRNASLASYVAPADCSGTGTSWGCAGGLGVL